MLLIINKVATSLKNHYYAVIIMIYIFNHIVVSLKIKVNVTFLLDAEIMFFSFNNNCFLITENNAVVLCYRQPV